MYVYKGIMQNSETVGGWRYCDDVIYTYYIELCTRCVYANCRISRLDGVSVRAVDDDDDDDALDNNINIRFIYRGIRAGLIVC